MTPHRDEIDLSTELRALRPAPSPAFTAALDARAEAGFPKPGRQARSTAGRISERLRAVAHAPARIWAIPNRRLLAASGAAAIGGIALATALVLTSEGGSTPTGVSTQPMAIAETGNAVPREGRELRPFSKPLRTSSAGRRGSAPSVGSGSVGAGANAAAPADALEGMPSSSGPYARADGHRDVERSAEIALGTDASGVRRAAAKVLEAVHAYRGIVLRSSIADNRNGEATATFSLLIPSGKLGDAMATFSRIAEVRSRHESSLDVTAPTIGLRERLQEARAKVASLLTELSRAETEAEREAAGSKLRVARRHLASLRARLAGLRRRTHLSAVSLRVEAGSTPVAGGNGWGIDDALGDAGHVLAVAAGVALVGLAILVPPILLALLAWLLRRTWVRTARRRALD